MKILLPAAILVIIGISDNSFSTSFSDTQKNQIVTLGSKSIVAYHLILNVSFDKHGIMEQLQPIN